MGLHDMVLLKENHIFLAGGIESAVAAAHGGMKSEGRSVPVEVEVGTLDQLEQAVRAGASWIMLDNMDLRTMARAVDRVAEASPRPKLEASGGITLDSVRDVAETGVDYISVGSITHSPVALDLSLLFRRMSA